MKSVWEFKELTFAWDVKRNDVRAMLTSLAEIEHWEIDRVRIYGDGHRVVRLRRRIMRLERTA
jgi:hypothetical protein